MLVKQHIIVYPTLIEILTTGIDEAHSCTNLILRERKNINGNRGAIEEVGR